MAFVLCEPCGRQVVVDPSGTCPEGHRTGVVSARAGLGVGRVATAIGHRSSGPDPDEPQPWIGRIEVDELSLVGTDGAAPPPAPREIRPPAGPTAHEVPAQTASPTVDDVDRDALLRELHALGGDAPDEPVAASVPPPPPTRDAPSSAGGHDAPTLRAVPDLEDRRAAAAELASLESALADLASPAPSTPDEPPTPGDAAAPDGLEELAELARTPRAEPERSQPPPPEAPSQVPERSEPPPPIMGGFTAHGRKKRLFGR